MIELTEENHGWWVAKGWQTTRTSEGWIDLDHYVLFLVTKNYCGKIVCYPDIKHETWLHGLYEFKRFEWD